MRKIGSGKIAGIVVFCVATAIASHAQIYTPLFSFDGLNGATPYNTDLIQASDGSFLGTTFYGGAADSGTVFQITAGGQESTLYSFCRQDRCTDGYGPNGPMLQGANGSLYGTTAYGGTSSYRRCATSGTYGCGTVFELTLGGELKTLYSFCSQANCADGSDPSRLVLGPNGNFYGTTMAGGANCFTNAQGYGCGTVFEITPAGKLTTLYSFCVQTGCPDGISPNALALGYNGNFYGTAAYGGHCLALIGCGVVFEITPSGKLTTLHSFCSLEHCADGWTPLAGLVQAINGDLYGTTSNSIDIRQDNGGTVFGITLGGKLTTFYHFCSQPNCADGETPSAALVEGTDGNLYGTTPSGGSECNNTGGCGTIFQITLGGKLSTLYNFCSQPNCTDGSYPFGPLMQGTDGIFYGAAYGGANNDGVVYSLSVGLAPFVEAIPNFGGIGQVVYLLGNNLKGTSQVLFNDAEANFDVLSNTLIRTTVPEGAATGVINVVTPNGVLSGDGEFQVLP